MQHFHHTGQRQCVDVFAGLHQQRRQDRQGERYADHETAAAAQFRLDLDLPAQLTDARLHHVHADAAAGNVGDLLLGREPWQEHQVQAFLAAQAGGGFRIDQALLARLGAQFFRIDAGAIVLHFDADVVAFLLCRQAHVAHPRLALRFAQVRHFHAMIDGVADQVHQRVGQCFDQVAVELGFGADQFQVHFLLQRTRNVARHLREAREHLADRLHAGAHHRRLQARGGDIQRGHGAVQLFIAQARAQRLQPVS